MRKIARLHTWVGVYATMTLFVGMDLVALAVHDERGILPLAATATAFVLSVIALVGALVRVRYLDRTAASCIKACCDVGTKVTSLSFTDRGEEYVIYQRDPS